LLNIPTIDLKACIRRKKAKEQDHLMKSMAPRRLPTPYVLQRFPLLKQVWENTCHKLDKRMREQEGMREKSGRDGRGEERFW
jgi:hypothetical protein